MIAQSHLENRYISQDDYSSMTTFNIQIRRAYHSTALSFVIDLFSLYVLFSHLRPRDATPENSFFQVSSYARANVRITCEKTKGKFP